MRFSELIRSSTRPQAFGTWVIPDPKLWTVAACALAGAFEKANLIKISWSKPRRTGFRIAMWRARWRWPILRQRQQCPVCRVSRFSSVMYLCIHLNDQHHWTREQIADWVEQGERALFPMTFVPTIPDVPNACQDPESSKMWDELATTSK